MHKVYSSGSLVSTLNTEILAKKVTLCKEWSLSTDLKFPNRSTTELRNFFSLHVNKKTEQLDQPILAVSVRPDQSNVMLMIAYNISSSQSYNYNLTKKVNAGNWINLKISQMSGSYEIKVDYELVYTKPNFGKWKDVSLVTGNTYGTENILAIVHYRNFEINTCKPNGKK